MNDDSKQGRSIEDGACTYCGAQMAATSRICLGCGMPRFQAEGTAGLRTPTPSPKLMALRKAYVPDAQHYAAIPDEPNVTVPPPRFDELPHEGTSRAIANAAKDVWSRGIRPAAIVLLIAALVFAVVFGVGKAWQSRAAFRVDLKDVRTKVREISRSYVRETQENLLPHYTATPMSRSSWTRRAAGARSVPPRTVTAMEVQTAPTSSAPVACGPGILQVQIAPPPPPPRVIPAGIQNSNTAPLTSGASH
jgi:hypothetical protein